jgi:cobalt-precorrin 5A hydrolase
LTQSHHSQRVKNTGSVAEALAVTGAGEGAHLLGRRVVSEDRMATCAVAVGVIL